MYFWIGNKAGYALNRARSRLVSEEARKLAYLAISRDEHKVAEKTWSSQEHHYQGWPTQDLVHVCRKNAAMGISWNNQGSWIGRNL